MLHRCLTFHATELIAECRNKIGTRFAPFKIPLALNHGITFFLQQLMEALFLERTEPVNVDPQPTPVPTEIDRAAVLYSAHLLRLGYGIDQIVHDYGDVCHCVTDLAGEYETRISIRQLRTLDQCLDNAIADAISSFWSARRVFKNHAETLQQRLDLSSIEHKPLVNLGFPYIPRYARTT